MAYEKCDAVAVPPYYERGERKDRVWTCAQRAGHLCRHNEGIPKDGCTSWDDHCPRCAEHPPCRCGLTE